MQKAAPENRRTVHDFASQIIFINLAAGHSTAILLSHVLFNLAAYTPYIEPLREEISTVIKEGGWNKIALEKMRKLDNFIKESQKVNVCAPAGAVLRSAKNFSDGAFIPRGTALAVAERRVNQDSQIYNDRQKFDGFRFVDRDPLKWQVTAINDAFIEAFGTGRSAGCPGRFFAIVEVKATICRLLLEYDIKLTNEECGRPKDIRIMGLFRSPNKGGKNINEKGGYK